MNESEPQAISKAIKLLSQIFWSTQKKNWSTENRGLLITTEEDSMRLTTIRKKNYESTTVEV